MPANKAVIKALFESYVNFRKSGWGSNPPQEKTEIVRLCLHDIDAANDWQTLVDSLCDRAEIEAAKNISTGVTGFLSRRVKEGVPLILETIVAAISYIQASQENTALKQAYQQTETNVRYYASYETNGNFADLYFKMRIAQRADALALNEKSFADFIQNVENGMRRFVEVNKISKIKTVSIAASEVDNGSSPAIASTSFITAAMGMFKLSDPEAANRPPTPKHQVNLSSKPPTILIHGGASTYADKAAASSHRYNTRSKGASKWQPKDTSVTAVVPGVEAEEEQSNKNKMA